MCAGMAQSLLYACASAELALIPIVSVIHIDGQHQSMDAQQAAAGAARMSTKNTVDQSHSLRSQHSRCKHKFLITLRVGTRVLISIPMRARITGGVRAVVPSQRMIARQAGMHITDIARAGGWMGGRAPCSAGTEPVKA